MADCNNCGIDHEAVRDAVLARANAMVLDAFMALPEEERREAFDGLLNTTAQLQRRVLDLDHKLAEVSLAAAYAVKAFGSYTVPREFLEKHPDDHTSDMLAIHPDSEAGTLTVDLVEIPVAPHS